MKIQIDTMEKIIRVVDSSVVFGELIKELNKILPKREWKTFSLETRFDIVWEHPYIIYPTVPVIPTIPAYPWITWDDQTFTVSSKGTGVTFDTHSVDYVINDGVYNIEIG